MIVFGKNIFSQTLRSGDTIKVHASSFLVPVSGGIANEGLYEMKKGETLQDLIEFAGGVGSSFSGNGSIFIRRFINQTEEFVSINETQFDDTELYARDAVILPFFSEDIFTVKWVKISGMVNRPGTYAINDGAPSFIAYVPGLFTMPEILTHFTVKISSEKNGKITASRAYSSVSSN